MLEEMRRPIYMHVARIGQALASPVRLRALNLMAQRPWRVGDLADELGESWAATSAHLKVLRAACLVVDEKRGRDVWCRVESEEVLHLLHSARRAAETLLPELHELVREARANPHLLPSFDLREIAEDVRQGRITLIDLRPIAEYEAGHLPRAISLPFAELEQADLCSLKKSRVVAYCRGPWCVMAREGVKALNDRGVHAQLLAAGVVEWRVQSLELERGPSLSLN